MIMALGELPLVTGFLCISQIPSGEGNNGTTVCFTGLEVVKPKGIGRSPCSLVVRALGVMFFRVSVTSFGTVNISGAFLKEP